GRRGGRDRRIATGTRTRYTAPRGDVAEWLRSGLQIRAHRFDSGRRLQSVRSPWAARFDAGGNMIPLRRRLRDGAPLVATFSIVPSVEIVQLVALAGFEAVVLD